jgi:hypothetical protein
MTVVDLLRKWLATTPLKGRLAILFSVMAVAVPTVIRVWLDGIVVGLGFSAYFPFVLLAAILLEWKLATVVALVSAALTDALFVGSRYQLLEGPTDVFGVVSFLVGAFLIIGLVEAIRTAFEDLVGPTAAGGVMFSLKDGQAWASWPTAGFHLSLGPRDDVAEMMKDFVAQVELGKRLAKEARPDIQRVLPT